MRLNLLNAPVQNGQILGCVSCPLDNVPGIFKIRGLKRIKQRRAMLWAQSPGGRENEQKLELVGPSGELVWKALNHYGLSRDMFDIQNVLRCRPVGEVVKLKNDRIRITGPFNKEHPPQKQELLSCSLYNDEALRINNGKADVHVILGDVAGEQLLGASLHKDTPIFWYEPWEAYVVFNYHPSYLLRKGGGVEGSWDHTAWKTRFKAVRTVLDHPGRWGYVKAQNYSLVRTMKQFDAMETAIRAEAKAGRRVSLDFEDSTVDGQRIITVAGFGIGHFRRFEDWNSWSGQAWSIVLDHEESGYTDSQLDQMKERTRALIADKTIKKTLQNGSHDDTVAKEVLGTYIGGYDYDTRYGTYLRYSFLRSLSLESQATMFFPEFCDYKSTVDPWYAEGVYHKAPLERLMLRNCGDCDVTQRLEQRFAPQVKQPLVRVYINAGKTLDDMETRGPVLDRVAWKKAVEIIPRMIETVDRALIRISEDPQFDCNKPEKVAQLIYDKLGLPSDEENGRSTNKTVLEKLLAENPLNKELDLVMKGRGLKKIKSTYLDPYAKSADMHDGELRTIWHLTGAATGRLRSGKGSDGDVQGVINFQNLHSNALLQNLLVGDKNWRQVYEWCQNPTKSIPGYVLDTEVLLAADGSQIELRALAELSGDKLLIQQFQEAAKDRHNPLKDVHCQVGHMMTGWELERIHKDKKTRRVCKNIHFGLAFGLGEDAVYPYVVAKMRAVDGPKADLSDITPKRMKKLHSNYFKKYVGVRRFIDSQRIKVEAQGFAETLFGFRREIRKDDETRNTYWGNQAINTPVQGTAHQFLLIAMALLNLKPKTYWALQRCIMEVHDALYFRVKLRYLAEAYKQLMNLFEVDAYSYAKAQFHLNLQVPLLAEASAGMTMGSMIDYTGAPLEKFLPEWFAKQKEVDAKPWEEFMPTTMGEKTV